MAHWKSWWCDQCQVFFKFWNLFLMIPQSYNFLLYRYKHENTNRNVYLPCGSNLFGVLVSYNHVICSGHRIGTAEVESALVSHPKCAEAAVVGVEHAVCIECIIFFLCAGHRVCFCMKEIRFSFCLACQWLLLINYHYYCRWKDRVYMHLLQ